MGKIAAIVITVAVLVTLVHTIVKVAKKEVLSPALVVSLIRSALIIVIVFAFMW